MLTKAANLPQVKELETLMALHEVQAVQPSKHAKAFPLQRVPEKSNGHITGPKMRPVAASQTNLSLAVSDGQVRAKNSFAHEVKCILTFMSVQALLIQGAVDTLLTAHCSSQFANSERDHFSTLRPRLFCCADKQSSRRACIR